MYVIHGQIDRFMSKSKIVGMADVHAQQFM